MSSAYASRQLPRFGRGGTVACTECGRPVTCGQGARHLSCSPTCPACFMPMPSLGHKCSRKKSD